MLVGFCILTADQLRTNEEAVTAAGHALTNGCVQLHGGQQRPCRPDTPCLSQCNTSIVDQAIAALIGAQVSPSFTDG